MADDEDSRAVEPVPTKDDDDKREALVARLGELPSEDLVRMLAAAEKLDSGLSMVSLTYQAPVPPPDMLREFETIVPGIAERMAKAPVRLLEARADVIRAEITHEKRRINGAIFLGTLLLLLAGYALYLGHEIAGTALGLGGVISIVARTVRQWLVRRSEQSDVPNPGEGGP